MVRLQVTIISIPERAKEVKRLKRTLPAETGVFVDTDHRGHWYAFRSAWLMTRGDATHHLLLEDDVLPCDALVPSVVNALVYQSNEVTSFFGRRAVIEKAYHRGDAWCVMNGISWAQAICLPASMIAHFIDWCDRHVRPSFRFACARLSLYCLHHDIPIWYSVPCLVEHRNLPSTLGNPNTIGGKPRTARIFTGESAVEHDWTRGIADPLTDRTYRLSLYKDWRISDE